MNPMRIATLMAGAAFGIATAPAALGQDGMGRLFYTPAQRAQLDVARQQNLRAPIATDQPEDAQQVPQQVTVNGMIRRNDGRSTVWVNNKMYSPEALTGGPVDVQARGSNAVTLSLPQSGRSVDLKVGQSVEALSGQIADVYQSRSRTPPPTEAAPAAEPRAGGTPPPANTPGSVEKVTAAPPSAPAAATKATEAVERKRKLDDGVPWGMIQSDTK
jgi:hypothetical protein